MIPDNARPEDLPEDPEGFWDPIHAAVQRWMNVWGQEDDGDTD